uniref:DUF7886 domain-containing protein n=1 Tax=Callorhinchus milii TaxID=7868 RepID=V9L3X5_CALMI
MSVTGEGKERRLKRKLQQFLGDLAVLGSLQGFRYFSCWLRGCEELSLTVLSRDVSCWPGCANGGSRPPPGGRGESWVTVCDEFSQSGLTPLQKRFGHYSDLEPSLPPASPCEQEISRPELNSSLFLLAGYARYMQPYVWFRSSSDPPNPTREDICYAPPTDTPLKLTSTQEWGDRDVRIWDIVSELVQVNTWPPPANPFSVDLHLLESLPPVTRFLASGALLSFLQHIAINARPQNSYYPEVLEEAAILSGFHIKALYGVQRRRGRELGGEGQQQQLAFI